MEVVLILELRMMELVVITGAKDDGGGALVLILELRMMELVVITGAKDDGGDADNLS